MERYETKIVDVERRTYLKGQLWAKYIGFFDPDLSDRRVDNYFGLELTEAKINVNELRKWDDGDFLEFRSVDNFLTRLPSGTIYYIEDNGNQAAYNLTLLEPRVSNIQLSDHLDENDKVFGVLQGDICGYIVHTDQEERTVFVEDTIETKLPESGPVVPAESEISKPFPGPPPPPIDFWGGLMTLLQVTLGILFVAPLIAAVWPFLLVTGILAGTYFLTRFLTPIVKFLGKFFLFLFSLILILFMLKAFYNFVEDGSVTPEVVQQDDREERTSITPEPIKDSTQQQYPDTLISHFRKWRDYEGETFSGYIRVRTSDWAASTKNRKSFGYNFGTFESYGILTDYMQQHDQSKLNYLYEMFDSIRQSNTLDEKRFAEVIVSCIQDIPYTLILDNACDYRLYNSAFISKYLQQGGQCVPNITFGILSPVEFAATLDGDCDTRALLLYVLLDKFGYDVIFLSSQQYQHALIGINLPYSGVSKIIDGKRYVLWETTSIGIKPGFLPAEISNVKHWEVTQLSKN